MRIAFLLFFTCSVTVAQTPTSLRQKYGPPISETYRVRPEIIATVTSAKTGEICQILIKPASETQEGKPALLKSQLLNDVIDELAPKAERGTYIIGTFLNMTCLPNNDCWGTEESYERLEIYRYGGTDAYRDAYIHWKRDACKSLMSTNE
jgi:hypothetical protein